MNRKSLPLATPQKQSSSISVTMVQNLFENKGWIFRRMDDQNDFGVDAEIELVDDNQVTGTTFKCQIKAFTTSDQYRPLRVYVKRSSFHYWVSHNVPVVLFSVALKPKRIYWAVPQSSDYSKTARNIRITLSQSNELITKFQNFENFMRAWFNSFPRADLIRDIPFYHQMWTGEIAEARNWNPDYGTELDEHLHFCVRLLYRHMLELRSSVGLDNSHIIPLGHFYLRSCALNDNTDQLTYEVAQELLDYMEPLYLKALDHMLQRIAYVELTTDNATVINHFRNHELFSIDNIKMSLDKYRGKIRSITLTDGKIDRIDIQDKRIDDEHFQKSLEEKLKSYIKLRISVIEKEYYGK